MLQEQTHSVYFFIDSSVLWETTVRTLSETSNDHALCCMLNHGNTLVQLLHCLSLSSCQLESTLPPAVQLLLSQTQQDDLVGHCFQFSNFLEKISRPSCEPLYARNTSPLKEETFLYEYLCTESFCPQKSTRERCSSTVHSLSTVAILTTATSLWTCACVPTT
jgi:hypothetical protein